MSDTFSVELDGVDPLLRKLQRVERRSTQRSILRRAFKSATGPVKKAMRRNIRSAGAVRSRALAKSIRDKVKVYNSGIVVAVVGPNSKKVDGVSPSRYAHLVDKGVAPHNYKKKQLTHVQRYDGTWFTHRTHPGSKPKPFLKQTEQAVRTAVKGVFKQRLEILINRALTK